MEDLLILSDQGLRKRGDIYRVRIELRLKGYPRMGVIRLTVSPKGIIYEIPGIGLKPGHI